MRLIITGASGFLGKNLLLWMPKDWQVTALYWTNDTFPKFLLDHSLVNVSPMRCDLREQSSFVNLYELHYDCCVYLAANGDPSISVKSPGYDLKTNTLGLINFLEVVDVDRFIYMSSGEVYGGLTGAVSPEKSKLNPMLPYAISKLACEQYVKWFASRGWIKEYVILRFFGAYGPYEPSRKIYSRLVTELGIEGKTEVTVHGDGENYIDAMYIDDAMRGLMSVIYPVVSNVTLDFCAGLPLTINELVQLVVQELGRADVKIKHMGHVAEYNKFFSSARPFLGLNIARTKLGEGLFRLRKYIKGGKS